MASGRKRPRPEEETQADCPFTVTHPNPNLHEKNKNAKRRRQSEDASTPKIPVQPSPFTPLGKFKEPSNTMDRYYQVQPYQRWTDMTRYNSFVLNGVKYYSEGFIFVANSSTIERQKNPGEPRPANQRSEDDWVARILEIRASDEHHVYARVYWMYWPDELPAGTQDGRKSIQGRQPYHGQNELIASNHMDVINVVSVTAKAEVHQWDENNEDEVQKALYWRQAFNLRTMELSSAQPRCKCNRPENPDKQLINCTNSECKKWLHDGCLVHEALMKTFARLGTDEPHRSPQEKTGDLENGRHQLGASESGVDESTIKVEEVDGAGGTPDLGNHTVANRKRKGRHRKSETNGIAPTKPYDGLFSAMVINDSQPPLIQIRDLRENVTGGEKTWTEPIHCLLCNSAIH